jgi:hypothetical protein
MLIDLIAVYYSLEQDNTLPELPCGHRAISALSVTYTLVNHDYLGMAANSGVTYRSVIAAMKSESYKKEASKYTVNQRSPVNLTRKAVFAGQNHTGEKGYNLSGVLLLMHHVFINRPATKKILLKRYEPSELGDCIKYDVVRAAALLAGEMHPLPDPVALLLYLSCANLAFRRWGVHVYSKTIRTDDELKSTPYNITVEKGERVMSIQFDLCGVAPTRNALDDRSLHTKLKQSCYGALLPTSESCELIPMPFNPFIETRNAIVGGCGYYPTVKVSAEHLPQGVTQSDTTEQATQLLEEHEVIDSDENNDDDGAEDDNDEDEDVDETLLEDDSEHDEEIEDNEY